MTNYMTLLAKYYPGVGVVCEGDTSVYSNLIYVSGDPMPSQADLDAADFLEYKANHILSLSAACRSEIVNGFTSDALGTTHWYDSEEVDQLNLIGSVTSGDDMDYGCRETEGGDKVYKFHTNWQLQKVIQDGRDMKLTKLQSFSTKKAQVLAATTQAEVDAITW